MPMSGRARRDAEGQAEQHSDQLREVVDGDEAVVGGWLEKNPGDEQAGNQANEAHSWPEAPASREDVSWHARGVSSSGHSGWSPRAESVTRQRAGSRSSLRVIVMIGVGWSSIHPLIGLAPHAVMTPQVYGVILATEERIFVLPCAVRTQTRVSTTGIL